MNCIERTTLAYFRSVNDPLHPYVDYLPVAVGSPEEALITSVPAKYLTLAGDVLAEVDQPTKDSIDAVLLDLSRDTVVDELDQTETLLRAFANVMRSEINILRAEHSLPARTLAQLKSAMRQELGS